MPIGAVGMRRFAAASHANGVAGLAEQVRIKQLGQGDGQCPALVLSKAAVWEA